MFALRMSTCRCSVSKRRTEKAKKQKPAKIGSAAASPIGASDELSSTLPRYIQPNITIMAEIKGHAKGGDPP